MTYPGLGCFRAVLVLGCVFAVGIGATVRAEAAEGKLRHKRSEQAKNAVEKPRGPFHVIVSIGSQRVMLYSGGVLIGTAAVSTGMNGHPTPTGIFSVIQKHKWHRSNIYSAAPMPYMQRITWSGIALHAGVLPGYPASHGCIRLPEDFAVRLWGLTKVGARVIIAHHDVAPVDIGPLDLFAKPQSDEPVVSDRAEQPVAVIDEVKTAQAAISKATDASPALSAQAFSSEPAAPKIKETLPKALPISIFISRKEGKLFARQGFEPLFDAPVAIKSPDMPLGTHLYTAMEWTDQGQAMRWTAISIPAEAATRKGRAAKGDKRMSREDRKLSAKAVVEASDASTALTALNRVDIPKDTLERISAMLTPGSSLIVSDQGLGPETGEDTDFIVLTR